MWLFALLSYCSVTHPPIPNLSYFSERAGFYLLNIPLRLMVYEEFFSTNQYIDIQRERGRYEEIARSIGVWIYMTNWIEQISELTFPVLHVCLFFVFSEYF